MSARVFSVAFPNDGSQVDKGYFDDRGKRPSFVLFADLRVSTRWVNGICLSISDRQLRLLAGRERRYQLIDVTERVSSYPGFASGVGPIYAFVGKPEFTKPVHAALGVVPQSYLQALIDGAAFWESRVPGFWDDFAQSTTFPTPKNVHVLSRIDY